MIPHPWVMRAFELSSQRDPEVETLLRERVCPRWRWQTPVVDASQLSQAQRQLVADVLAVMSGHPTDPLWR